MNIISNDFLFHATLYFIIPATLSRTPAQILLRWSIQRGVSVVSKSSKIERIEENCQIFDFELTANEVHHFFYFFYDYCHNHEYFLVIFIIIILASNNISTFFFCFEVILFILTILSTIVINDI